MRRLLVLLSLVLALTIFASSNVLAERPLFESRLQSIVAMFRANVFPFCGSFFYVTEGEIICIGGGGTEFILGGDADDLGNGRINGGIIINPGGTVVSDCASGERERDTVDPRCE